MSERTHQTKKAATIRRDQAEAHFAPPVVENVEPVIGPEGGPVSQSVTERIESGRSDGAALDSATRTGMERALAHDFSRVRIHTDTASDALNQHLGASAFTTGSDIFFRAGAYAPGNSKGNTLLAHELTHVVQQQAIPTATPMTVGPVDDIHEREADAAAAAIVSGRAPILGAQTTSSHRNGPAFAMPPANPIARRLIQRDFPDPFGLGLNPPSATPTTPFSGPLGELLEGAAEKSAAPDPDDVYEQPPVNWNDLAAPVSGPPEPGPWEVIQVKMPLPLPFKRFDGLPTKFGVSDAQKAKASRVEAAFAAVMSSTETSWNAAAPGIKEFNTAAKDAAAQGLLGAGGEGWDKPTDDKQNLSAFGDQQKVGPEGNKTAVKDIFKDGGTQSAVDMSGVQKSEGLDKPLKQALVTSEENVVVAAKKFEQTLKQRQILADTIKLKITAMDIDKAKVEEAKLQAEKDKLAGDKADFDATVDRVTGIIGGLVDVVGAVAKDDPGALLKSGVGLIGIGIKAVNDADYDAKIAATSSQIAGIRGKIEGLQTELSTQDAAIACKQFEAQQTDVDAAKVAFAQAARARQDAYDAFAAAAGAAAGGGDAGAKVEGAIKAIPIVETVVARVQRVTSAIKLPAYNDDSGIGFHAAGSPKKFILGLSQLKGYDDTFKQEEKHWSERLTSLQKQATGLYSKA